MSSRPVITVAPVVVRPEIVSNSESVTVIPDARKGMAAIIGRNTQTSTVNRKPSLCPVRSTSPRDSTHMHAPIRMEPNADTSNT